MYFAFTRNKEPSSKANVLHTKSQYIRLAIIIYLFVLSVLMWITLDQADEPHSREVLDFRELCCRVVQHMGGKEGEDENHSSIVRIRTMR